MATSKAWKEIWVRPEVRDGSATARSRRRSLRRRALLRVERRRLPEGFVQSVGALSAGLEHRESLRHGPDGGADIFSFFGQSMHASQPSRIHPAAE